MALEHLNDQEYQVLKSQGIAGLDDDAYARLKLPSGYNHPTYKPTMENILGQGAGAPGEVSAGAQAVKALGMGISAANRGLEAIPVLGPALKSVGEKGKSVIANERQGAEDIGNALGPVAGGVAKGLTGVSSLVIPQDSLSTALLGAQVAAPALGAAGRALQPAEGIVGGALATGKTAKNIAAVGKVLSGTPELNLRSALENPGLLNETETASDVGGEMNAWGEKMGVKTGAEARGKIPAVAASASPRLGTGSKFADFVHQNIPKYEKAARMRSARISLLEDRIKNADQIAEEAALNRVRDVPPADSPIQSFMEGKSPRVGGANDPDADLINSSLAAQAAQQDMKAHASRIVDSSTAEIARLKAEGSEHLQHLLSARSVMSKLRGAPSLLNPREAEDAYLATQRLESADNAISKVADSVQPGSAEEYAGLVDRYHGAKVRESLSPMLAQNLNGTPSVLRAWASGAALLHGNPMPLLAQSPAAQAKAIRMAAFLRDMNAMAPSSVAGAGEAAGNVAGPAEIGLNALMRKDEEGK